VLDLGGDWSGCENPAHVCPEPYGTANDSETAPAPGLSNGTSAARVDGTKDTDNNSADFAAGNPSPGTVTSTPTEAKRHQQATPVRGFVNKIFAKDKGPNVIVT